MTCFKDQYVDNDGAAMEHTIINQLSSTLSCITCKHILKSNRLQQFGWQHKAGSFLMFQGHSFKAGLIRYFYF